MAGMPGANIMIPMSPGYLRTIWTGPIGISLFSSAMAGWLLFVVWGGCLASCSPPERGAMLDLAVTDLIPEAEERRYQESAAISVAAGFPFQIALREQLQGGALADRKEKR